MGFDWFKLHRRHEGTALIHTRRPIFGGQIIELLAGDNAFARLILGASNPLQLGASAIEMRRLADYSCPT
jgi:hypothetical protein